MCGHRGALVSSQTVAFQLINSLEPSLLTAEIMSLCMNPECEMAYYSADYGYLYLIRDIKTPLDHKAQTKVKYVCYCQKITYDAVKEAVRDQGISSVKEFFKGKEAVIVEKCKQVNPFGCSCIADIKKVIEEATN